MNIYGKESLKYLILASWKNGNLFIPQTNSVLSYLPSAKEIYNRFLGNWNQNRKTSILF